MKSELIGGYGALDEREQIGLFLRHAFPVEASPLPEMLFKFADEQRKENGQEAMGTLSKRATVSACRLSLDPKEA